MNTLVKRTKSTALGKKRNLSRGPTKHKTGYFPPFPSVLEVCRISGNRPFITLGVLIFNDRFYLSFFVATHGFRESDFDYYPISYLSAHISRPSVSMCVY